MKTLGQGFLKILGQDLLKTLGQDLLKPLGQGFLKSLGQDFLKSLGATARATTRGVARSALNFLSPSPPPLPKHGFPPKHKTTTRRKKTWGLGTTPNPASSWLGTAATDRDRRRGNGSPM